MALQKASVTMHIKKLKRLIEFLAQLSVTFVTLFNYVGIMLQSIYVTCAVLTYNCFYSFKDFVNAI